jgi:signal peptidase
MTKRVLDKIFSFFLNFLLVIVVIISFFSIYSYVSINILDNSYVNVFGYTFFEVVSGSMGESIKVDDLVIVKINSSYKKGDIITYYSDGDFITHRVVSIDGDKIITRGDANNGNDSPINDSVVLGKVVYIASNVGIWKRVFMNPKVFISLLITLVLFSFTFSYNKKSYKKNKNKDNFEDYSVSDLHITDDELPYKGEE